MAANLDLMIKWVIRHVGFSGDEGKVDPFCILLFEYWPSTQASAVHLSVKALTLAPWLWH